MDNLQTEVLEIEFLTYSKGMTTISEEDFAKILLRFTNVENINAYMDNVRQCIPDEKVPCTHARSSLPGKQHTEISYSRFPKHYPSVKFLLPSAFQAFRLPVISPCCVCLRLLFLSTLQCPVASLDLTQKLTQTHLATRECLFLYLCICVSIYQSNYAGQKASYTLAHHPYVHLQPNSISVPPLVSCCGRSRRFVSASEKNTTCSYNLSLFPLILLVVLRPSCLSVFAHVNSLHCFVFKCAECLIWPERFAFNNSQQRAWNIIHNLCFHFTKVSFIHNIISITSFISHPTLQPWTNQQTAVWVLNIMHVLLLLKTSFITSSAEVSNSVKEVD